MLKLPIKCRRVSQEKTPIQHVLSFKINIQGPLLMFGCPVSQASNLGQDITAENAKIPELMFSFQKLNETTF